MRSLFTLLFGLIINTLSFAQPANDNCAGATNLGTLPSCDGDIYTNVNATTSNIGSRNSPTCFNGGTTQRDVWFSFTPAAGTSDITIFIQGVNNGTNAKALSNPQIAVYRGDCSTDGLSEIACSSAPNGANQLRLDVFGLSAGDIYFVRINDYSATAAPNAGDFTLCIEQYVPAINMGDSAGSNACFGTLYDSGGPDGDYSDFENSTFTICPTEPNSCLEIDLISFDVEPVLLGIFGDFLRFYAGPNTSSPLIAELYGQDSGTPFRIQSKTGCITVEFESDFLVSFPGFELTWQCSSTPCDNQSLDNPTEISGLPFTQTGLSTCESAATFGTSPCVNDNFLNGPEYVFTYNSLGGTCINIEVSGANEGTGVLVVYGSPTDSSSTCVARGTNGIISSANLRSAGTYYIIVSDADGCTPFDIKIEETTCSLSPALVDALCNPLNGCVRLDGLPTIFDFEDGFQDIEIERDVNNGCWLGFGVEPNYYWFTIQSQADGPFGFILNSANPGVPSDLDFNVWGPFTQDQVCENKDQVIAFIRNNQPIRSSWSPTPGVTGLADRHPIFNTPVTDEYDCGDEPGADGDDFVSTIPTLKGEVYVVLINDWGNLIGEEGVGINWSPSAPAVLEQLPSVVEAGDTSICLGESVQLEISSPVSSIIWLDDTNTLSCDDCPNPIATPTQTTIYRALVDAVCYNDTIDIKVEVFSVNAGPDVTVCRGEKFDIIAGSSFDDAVWQWNVPAGIEFSCLDCPNPTVSANTPGTYQIIVSLTAPDCTPRDTVVITVRPEQAPEYSISDDLEICQGESVNLGGAPNANTIYEWTSIPEGFTSTDANPEATPLQTTKYFLNVSTPACPITKLDSVSVTVFIPPVLEVAADTSVCQEQPVQLGLSQPEDGVTYEWTGPDFIDDPANLNTLVFPTAAGDYIVTATRGACEVKDTVQMGITPIDIAIQVEGQEPDTVRLCRGEELNLTALAVPANTPVIWTPADGSLSDTIGTNIIAKPETQTTYYATVTVGECIRIDSIIVIVDSLPSNLAIMPGDTSICEGSLIILESELFEPKDFMEIEFKWFPGRGQQTPDSLYNLVIQPDTTTQYYRITTNGVCVDTAYANVEVKPIPQLQIIPSDTTVCPGEKVQYRVEGPDGLTKPMWMPPTGLSCTECFNPTATAFASVSYQFMAELDGCPGSASTSLNVPVPQISLNPRTEICLGETIRLNFANTPGATYTWTSSSDPNFRSNDPLLTVTPTQNTTYKVVAQVEGCEPIEASISIIVVQDADVNVPDNQTICEGSSITLTADGTAPNGVTETFLWRWNGQTMANPTITVNNLTDDTVFELIYTYGRNCGVVTKTVLVEVAPAPVLELNPDRVICAGETIQLNLNASNSPEVIYTWTSPGNPNFTSSNPLLSVSPTQTTTYRVKAESQGCGTLEQEITVTVVSAAEVNITGNTSICQGQSLSLTASSNLPANIPGSYLWIGNGQQFTGNNLIVNNLTQNTQFVLVYTYGDCGEVVRTVDVVVNQAIQVDSISISPNANNLFLGQTLTITANTTPATPVGATYAWTANGESINGNTPQISHTPEESPVTYEVTITSAAGCTTTTAITVTLNEPVVDIPNAFTPNGDGRNDFFNVIPKSPLTVLEFKVYNRWGQLVYNNENPSQGWDGKHNGNDAPSDVYVYYIRVRFLTNREELLTGDVTLIR